MKLTQERLFEIRDFGTANDFITCKKELLLHVEILEKENNALKRGLIIAEKALDRLARIGILRAKTALYPVKLILDKIEGKNEIGTGKAFGNKRSGIKTGKIRF